MEIYDDLPTKKKNTLADAEQITQKKKLKEISLLYEKAWERYLFSALKYMYGEGVRKFFGNCLEKDL